MTVLSVNKLVKTFDGVDIIDNLSFGLNKGDKLALVGKNGSGKTTLLKMISGLETVDGGNVSVLKGLSLRYVDQKDDMDVDLSIREFCMTSFTELILAEEELRKLEMKMQEIDHERDEFERLLHDYTEKSELFKERGGYIYKSKVNGILAGLGFEHKELGMPLSKLSGGMLGRLKLAKSLIDEPDILLMDEPTNHLDIKAVEYLESFLSKYGGSFILVSHDRYFLDRVTNKTLELTDSGCFMFDGNYSEFKVKKEALLKSKFKEYEKNRKERERQEEIIKRFKGHGTELLARRAKSREKMLDRMEKLDDPRLKNKKIELTFEKEYFSGKEVLFADNLEKSFGKLKVLKGVSFKIYQGEKIGLIGSNGSGKSTLFKIIMGEITDYNGSFELGYRVVPAYYDQRLKLDNDKNTILEEMQDFAPNLDATDIRSLMGRFLFFDDDIFKPIYRLSGGERARVLLAKLFLKRANFLLLDEPTNHLDIYAKDVIEESLSSFDGTLFVISHDRYFLDNVCTKILELDDGKVTLYHGNYSYYLEKRQEKKKHDESKLLKKENKPKSPGAEEKKLRRKLEKLEAEIESVSHETGLLNEEMFDHKNASCPEILMEKSNRLKDLEMRHDELLEEYMALHEQLDALEGDKIV